MDISSIQGEQRSPYGTLIRSDIVAYVHDLLPKGLEVCPRTMPFVGSRLWWWWWWRHTATFYLKTFSSLYITSTIAFVAIPSNMCSRPEISSKRVYNLKGLPSPSLYSSRLFFLCRAEPSKARKPCRQLCFCSAPLLEARSEGGYTRFTRAYLSIPYI